MNKFTALLSLAVLAASVADARTLSPGEALARVSADTDAPARIRRAGSEGATSLIRTTMSADGAPMVYMFNCSEGGYLVVSADDVALPLLGYADAGSISATEELPPQLEWWLGEYAQEIAAYNANAPRYAAFPEEAAKITRPQRTPIEPLLKTTWNQDAPYNNQCPTQSGKRTYTGCVATAMAQVMKYFNYPEKGSGRGQATVNGSGSSNMSLAVTFDWDNMLDNYTTGSYNSTQASAVALLMKAVGYSVNMNYSTSGSAAAGIKVPTALIDNFSYDAGARYYERDYYGILDWEEMVYNNLRNVGPVYYDGQAPAGGHAFVCDGYSHDGYFHFNWGWGGAYNGYFLLTALNPEGQGIGGYAGGYNSGQGIVLGIQKPTGKTPEEGTQLSMISGMYLTATVTRTYLSLGGSSAGSGQSIVWYNANPNTISIEIGVKITLPSTGQVFYNKVSSSTLQSRYGMSGISVPTSLLSDIPVGQTAQVQLVTRPNGSNGEWEPVLCPIGQIDYVYVTRQSTDIYKAEVPDEAVLDMVSGSLDTPVYEMKPVKMTVTLENASDTELLSYVSPTLFDYNPSTGAAEIMGYALPEFFDILPGEEETREMVFTINYVSQKLQTGKQYYMGLLDFNKRVILGLFPNPITYQAAPAMGTLSVKDFSIEGGNVVRNPEDIKFNSTVTLNSGYFAGSLYIAVTDARGNIFATTTTPTMFIDGGQSASTTTTLGFPDAVNGTTYYAHICTVTETSEGAQLTPLSSLTFKVEAETGIEGVAPDETSDAPVEYYNLQGIRILHPDRGNIYIQRQGSNVSKIRF